MGACGSKSSVIPADSADLQKRLQVAERRAQEAEKRARAAEGHAESGETQQQTSDWDENTDALLSMLGVTQNFFSGFAAMSAELQGRVTSNVKDNGLSKSQHPIYQALGLQVLLEHSESTFKPIFDRTCEAIVRSVPPSIFKVSSDVAALADPGATDDLDLRATCGCDLTFLSVPVKSYKSAVAKVSVDYNGDVTLVKDAVRGTLLVTVAAESADKPPAQCALVMYRLVRHLLEYVAKDKSLECVGFKDRYVEPAGGYRDFLLLLAVNGFVCELQVPSSRI